MSCQDVIPSSLSMRTQDASETLRFVPAAVETLNIYLHSAPRLARHIVHSLRHHQLVLCQIQAPSSSEFYLRRSYQSKTCPVTLVVGRGIMADDKRVPVWLDCDPGHDVSPSDLLVPCSDFIVREMGIIDHLADNVMGVIGGLKSRATLLHQPRSLVHLLLFKSRAKLKAGRLCHPSCGIPPRYQALGYFHCLRKCSARVCMPDSEVSPMCTSVWHAI